MSRYLERIQQIYTTTSRERLEAYWQKALSLSSGRGMAHAQRVCLNLLSLSEEEEKPAEWWQELSPEERKAYLEQHPNSKYADDVELEGQPVPEEEDTQDHGLDSEPIEEENGPDDEPGEADEAEPVDEEGEETPADNTPVSLKDLATEKWNQGRAKAAAVLGHHKKGVGALKSLMTGEKVPREDLKAAMSTAKLGMGLVLGALAGIAVFTVLAPALPALGKLFVEHVQLGSGDDYSFSSTSSEDDAAEILDAMHAWLLDQDLEELTNNLKQQGLLKS